MNLKQQAAKELAKRELERRYQPQRSELIEYMKFIFENEKSRPFIVNWHHKMIADALNQVLEGKITRLIINIPPGHTKTEEVTKAFAVWALGKRPELKICATGYSTALTQTYSGEARDYYSSQSNNLIFPRLSLLREDQNTKEWWANAAGGGYYATGTGGSITGRRFNVFIIDDPLKPDEAESDVKRIGINNWYDNTVVSRLNDPLRDAVIIIMQRTHENDLCGYLMQKELEGTGEKWVRIVLPAIAEKDEEFRKEGEALDNNRFPLEALETLKKGLGPVNFSCQYQQNPIAKESQEFHEEWFRYYHSDQEPKLPTQGRIFTTCDPAFTKKDTSDYSAIITAKFLADKVYILEVTHGKFDPAELEDKLVYHVRKWRPEKIGIEAVQAQQLIGFSLKNRLQKESLLTAVEDLKQSGDKETRIRRLIPLYRNGLIYHHTDMKKFEEELLKFPRGSHDDQIDALQMLYDMYSMQPNIRNSFAKPRIEYDQYGRPKVV